MSDIVPPPTSAPSLAEQHTSHHYHDNVGQGNSNVHNGPIYQPVYHNYASDTTAARQEERYRDILRWLDAPNPKTDHHEAQRRYEKDTGEWFLESEEFEDWLEGNRQLIWLHGPPGCCKTILCSAAIEKAKENCSTVCPVVYFYFTFRDARKQNYEGLLLAILAQLLNEEYVPPSLQIARDRNWKHTGDLESAVIELVTRCPRLHVLIDGLDESPESDGSREKVMDGLQSLTSACPDLMLLIASRKESDIQHFMSHQMHESQPYEITAKRVDEDIQLYVARTLERDRRLRALPEATKGSISEELAWKAGGMFRWADLQLDAIKRLKVLRPKHVEEVLKNLPRTLDKTYDRILLQLGQTEEVLSVLRWVAFYKHEYMVPISISELRDACITRYEPHPVVDVSSRQAIDQLLLEMSSLLRFEGDDSVSSDSNTDSVTNDELEEGEMTHGENSSHCSDDAGSSEDVLSTIPFELQEQPVVRVSFAHRTVEEYLVSDHIEHGPAAAFHLDGTKSYHRLAQTCIAYLLQIEVAWRTRFLETSVELQNDLHGLSLPLDIFDLTNPLSEHVIRNVEAEYPLWRHAVMYWSDYQRTAERRGFPRENCAGLQVVLLQAESAPDMLRCVSLHFSAKNQIMTLALARSATNGGFALIMAAAIPLVETTKLLLNGYVSKFGRTHDLGMALIASSNSDFDFEQSDTLQHLLNMSVGIETSTDCTLAHYDHLAQGIRFALVHCVFELSKLIFLLQVIDPRQNCIVNALCCAVFKGDSLCVRLFLDSGVDPNSHLTHGLCSTPLQLACHSESYSDDRIISLLDHGADPNLPTHGIRPLWILLSEEDPRSGVVLGRHKALLDAGADPNSGRDDGENAETALQLASRKEMDDVVGVLLQAGAIPDFVIKPHSTAINQKPPKRHGVSRALSREDTEAIISDFEDRIEEARRDQQAGNHTSDAASEKRLIATASLGLQPWPGLSKAT